MKVKEVLALPIAKDNPDAIVEIKDRINAISVRGRVGDLCLGLFEDAEIWNFEFIDPADRTPIIRIYVR